MLVCQNLEASEAGHQVLENWRRYGDFQNLKVFSNWLR